MTRNLKALGLALLAVFAMGAVMASGASAGEPEETELTAEEYPAIIDGTNNGVNRFIGAFGIEVECEEATYSAEISKATTSVTATPIYKKCHSGARPATVTMNGCDYLLHDATEVENENTHSILSDLDCETTGPGPVEVHIYNDEAHEKPWCTVKIDNPNTQRNLTGLHTTNTTEPSKDIDLTGTVHSIKSHAKGTCSFGLNIAFEGELETNVTLSGTNAAKEAQGIDVG